MMIDAGIRGSQLKSAHDYSTTSARFAARVAQRHVRMSAAIPLRALRRVFVRMSRPGGSVTRVSLTYAPTIQARFSSPPRSGARNPARMAVLNAWKAPAERETRCSNSIAPLLERSAARAVREDGRGKTSTGDQTASGKRSVVRRQAQVYSTPVVERVHRRLRSVQPESTTPTLVERDAHQQHRRGERNDRVIGTVGHAALSPVEIGRLTDQIMRTIDHRIVAYRERQGRA